MYIMCIHTGQSEIGKPFIGKGTNGCIPSQTDLSYKLIICKKLKGHDGQEDMLLAFLTSW